MNYKNIINKQYCNFVKQSKAKQSKAKQSKAKLVLYLLNNFKFLFQKYFFYLVKSFLTLIKFNFDSLSEKIKNLRLVINKKFIFKDNIMKKVLLFFILINLSLFAQSYINSLYDAIKENNPIKIIDIANNYKIDLNNVFYMPEDVYLDGGGEGIPVNISPLIYAIKCKNIEAIDTLLKLGANVWQFTDIYSDSVDEFRDFFGFTNRVSITPLMYAAYSSTEEVISFLIKKGAKVNSKDREGRTALIYGSSEALIRAGADVNAKDKEGKTALMYWLNEALIRAGANVNAKDNDGWTALMYACDGINYSGEGETFGLDLDIIKSLIRAGANINEVNNYGNTALMLAIHTYKADASLWREDDTSQNFETIRFLIYKGANVNIKNKDGETPISLSKGFPKLTKLLKDNGAY